MEGPLTIGEDNVFFPYSTVGVAPQDLKYKGERSELRIGHRNRIREFATLHRGTEGGGMITSIGDDNLLMAYTHVAHDVQLGSHVVLSHAATLGGHVMVEDWAWIGAATGVHQFCRIGRHAIVGGYSVITRDVLPFSNTVTEREAKVFGANSTGLERRGFSSGDDRRAAQGVPPVDARRTQHRASRRTDSRGSAAGRGGLRPACPLLPPANAVSSSERDMDSSPATDGFRSWRWKPRARRGWRSSRSGSRRKPRLKSRLWRRAATGSRWGR